MTPCFPSPNKDWGYDVSDYRDIHPDYGTLHDADELISKARQRGIKVLFDLVPNHTSDRHEWFVDARTAKDAPCRDYYVWRDPGPGGSPPNNWLSVFGGPAWELDNHTGQVYLHNFLREQPDLDWWNEDVRQEFDEVLRFWFERGVAGFRIDVAHGIIKDQELRDNLPSTPEDPPTVQRIGQRATFSMNQPQVHEIHKRWRSVSDDFDEPERILVGETWVLELERMADFYGTGEDELHLAFNFPFIYAELQTDSMAAIVEETEALLPEASWPAWTGSNHDVGRYPTRWAGGDPARARCALLILMTLRGTPFLYYGDEIGMVDRPFERAELKDPVGITHWPEDPGRDPCRTPMHWNGKAGAGFTKGTPWLPIGDNSWINVGSQRNDPGSMLNLCRRLIALRKAEPDLVVGNYARLPGPEGTWVYGRGSSITVAINLGDGEKTIAGLVGRQMLSTKGAEDGRTREEVVLRPAEGVILKSED